jgi:hypothetical protein
MGFDKNDTTPLVQPDKPGTKINIGIAIGVAVFFAFGVVAVMTMRHHHF